MRLKIIVELKDKHNNNERYIIETKIEYVEDFEKVRQSLFKLEGKKPIKIKSDSFPWDKLFICGYGAGRGTQGTADYELYTPIDAVYTLFRYDQPLQNTELALRRLLDFGKSKRGADKKRSTLQQVNSMLRHVLVLKKGDGISLTPKGIEVQGRWGKVLLNAIGDGYKATTTLLLDLLSWNVLRPKPLSITPERISGIILVDELEQHLHPQWQRLIIKRLRDRFPHLQFIVTTHAPLCAGATADVPAEESKLVLLNRREDGDVELIDDLPLLSGMHVDQILASQVFGYLIESNVETEELLKEASILAGKGNMRTRAENNRYKKDKKRS